MTNEGGKHLCCDIAAAVNGECFAGDNNLLPGHGSMLQAVHQHNKLPGKLQVDISVRSFMYLLFSLLGRREHNNG